MNIEPLIAAFMVGLLGGTHCVGMCGGIVGALSTGLTDQLRNTRGRFLLVQVAYNIGRIASYTLAGVIAGTFAWHLGKTGVMQGFPLGKLVAGVIMILFGIYLTGWWHTLLWLERAGAWLRADEPTRSLAVLQTVPDLDGSDQGQLTRARALLRLGRIDKRLVASSTSPRVGRVA